MKFWRIFELSCIILAVLDTQFYEMSKQKCIPTEFSSVHHQLLELAQTHVHGVSDAIQLSYPLLFPFPPAFSDSQHPIRVFSKELVLRIRWPK